DVRLRDPQLWRSAHRVRLRDAGDGPRAGASLGVVAVRRGGETRLVRPGDDLRQGELRSAPPGAIHLAFCFSLRDGIALVRCALSFRDADLDLHASVLEIDGKRDQRVAALLLLLEQLVDLAAMKK